MLPPLLNIPLYKAFRKTGWPPIGPLSLTVSVTTNCNSRCKTCNCWKSRTKDLSLAQWKQILHSMPTVTWVSLTGGEPFLHPDFAEIVGAIAARSQPKVVTIATNGILTKKIIADTRRIQSFYHGHVIVNLSLDGVGEDHDSIRGVKCFDKVMKTYTLLKKENLTVGIHTVISKYNASKIEEISAFVRSQDPDSFGCELAQHRVELSNKSLDITPSTAETVRALAFLAKNSCRARGVSRVTTHLRRNYYKQMLTSREKGDHLPCYASIASAHLSATGDLWACCVRCESLGNLRTKTFKELWSGERARRIRSSIKDRNCSCTLANVSYTNLLCNL